jgi:uncharacterized membrane protein YoaK (UPF0700 family)
MTRLDRHDRLLVIGFAAIAGYVDAVGFLASSGFFISFMSGNSTRFAVGLASGADNFAIAGWLLASFVIGVTVGSLIGRTVQLPNRRRQALLMSMIAALLFAAPWADSWGYNLPALCLAAFAMGTENTLYEENGTVTFGLTYMTGALVKIGQGLAVLISGGDRFVWVPYLLLWSGLICGAASGATLFHQFGFASLWFGAGAAGIFSLILIMLRENHTQPEA